VKFFKKLLFFCSSKVAPVNWIFLVKMHSLFPTVPAAIAVEASTTSHEPQLWRPDPTRQFCLQSAYLLFHVWAYVALFFYLPSTVSVRTVLHKKVNRFFSAEKMSKVSYVVFSSLLLLLVLDRASAQAAMRLIITRWLITVSPRDNIGQFMPCPLAETPYSLTYTDTPYTSNFTQCYTATNYYVPQRYLLEASNIQGGCTNKTRWFTRFASYDLLVQAGVRSRGPCDPSFQYFEIPQSANFNGSSDTCYAKRFGGSNINYEFYKIECKSFDPASLTVLPYVPPSFPTDNNGGNSGSYAFQLSISPFVFCGLIALLLVI